MSDSGQESPRAHILVVEDSKIFREMQEMLLGQAGYAVAAFENPQVALAAAAKQPFELVVIDYELPNMNGQQFMHALKAVLPDIAVIFVSGALTLELAIQLSSQGVAGIFNKPANPKTLLEKINETLARNAARDTAARIGSSSGFGGARPAPPSVNLPEPTADQLAYPPRFVVGSSDRFRELTHRLWKVRDFRSVLLLQGEAGCPFELIARELAEISLFRDGPIMVCGGQKFEPRELIKALAPSLLSHDAGTLIVTGVEAFTTDQQRTLDNLISGREMFLPFARRFRLVIAATHELTDQVDGGAFDETLYYKISSLSLTVPSLREMRMDIVPNALRILGAQHEAGHISAVEEIAPDAAEWMEAQDWPGNYDQLATILVHAANQSGGPILTLAALTAVCGEHHVPITAVDAGAVLASSASGHELAGETRPPFPITSDLANEACTETVISASAFPSTPARAPVRTLTAHSLFRPASATYSFTQRLTDSLALADAACGTH